MARHNYAKPIDVKYDSEKILEIFQWGDAKFGRCSNEIVSWSSLSNDWVVLYGRHNSEEKLEIYWKRIVALGDEKSAGKKPGR